MTHTLWRGAELLGEADLRPFVDGPRGSLAGPFRPTAAFAAVWPTFTAVRAAQAPLGAVVASIPHDASFAEGRLASAGLMDVVRASLAAIDALGLVVRDAGGHTLAGVRATLSPWIGPGAADLTPGERAGAALEAALAGVAPSGPDYLLVVRPRSVRAGGAGAI